MTDMSANGIALKSSILSEDKRTKRRNAAERRFRMYGAICVSIAVIALVFLMSSILRNGASAFFQTYITLEIELREDKLDKNGNRDIEEIKKVSTFGYAPLIKEAINAKIEQLGVEIEGLSKPEDMISKEAAAQLRRFVIANPDVIGQTYEFEFLASGRIDGYYKGRVTMESAELDR
ncbi:MAG: DUF3333 domain-containing protein, partial [Pseudomonadota bacterium]